jgi:hypothetical protein
MWWLVSWREPQIAPDESQCHFPRPFCPFSHLLGCVRVLVALRPIKQRDIAHGSTHTQLQRESGKLGHLKHTGKKRV